MMGDTELIDEEPGTEESGPRDAAGFAAGLVVGTLLGAGIALLFAPDRGSRTRQRLGRRLKELGEESRARRRGRRRLRDRLKRLG